MNDRWLHVLLIVLLVAQLGLLSIRPEARQSPLLRWSLGIVGPVGQGMTSTLETTTKIRQSFRTRHALRAENEALRQRLEAAEREMTRLQGVEVELENLSRLSGYSRRETGSYVADVVFLDPSSRGRAMLVYTGTARPRRNQPVVSAQGLVGRVTETFRSYAKVLLLTDRASSVSAMVRRSRYRSVLWGASERQLELRHIPTQADVQIGDEIVTAGIDGVFPRGLLIGTVTSKEPAFGFYRVSVVPAVDFALLDQVEILEAETVPEDVKESLSGGAP